VQELLREGAISPGHARCLIGRADAEALAARIVNEELTVREVEALVQERKPAAAKARKRNSKSADTRAAEAELKEALGLEVDIRAGRGEKGELRIRYTSFDQLEDLRHRLLRRSGYR
jgi:ParB family chromosome partitioning protein